MSVFDKERVHYNLRGQFIADFLEHRGLTKTEFGRMCGGRSAQVITDAMLSSGNPTEATLKDIARGLNLPFEQLAAISVGQLSFEDGQKLALKNKARLLILSYKTLLEQAKELLPADSLPDSSALALMAKELAA